MVAAYWRIGREIVEEEQRGQSRAKYGSFLIKQLSDRLTADFGRGFSVANLKLIRQFYLTFRDRSVEIGYTPSSQSPLSHAEPDEVPHSASAPDTGRLALEPQTAPCPSRILGKPLDPGLSWSHYRTLMRVSNPEARSFYEVECAQALWSVRELERQIDSLLFERLARSRDRESVAALARNGHEVNQAADLIKDPYVLEFIGLPESSRWLESELEEALTDRLQQFLLELGRDLFFVARQKRITIDGDHFYIDLVFYHRELRCFLLIDLKVGRLSQEDIGQMLLYTGYFEAEEVRNGENPPIGLILCTSKNEAMVRYTLKDNARQVFASRYKLYLPSEEELAEEIKRERHQFEMQRLIEDDPDPG